MGIPASEVPYASARLTIRLRSAPEEFQARYEEAVPTLSSDQIKPLLDRQAPWQEMLDLINALAPWGFVIYHKIDTTATMRLNGNQGSGVAYLMGNHTIMERMFRYEPAVLLYAPLHTVIWSRPDDGAYFSFDRPSGQFGSFGNPEVTAVGLELDHKVAALLEHLGVDVPEELLVN